MSFLKPRIIAIIACLLTPHFAISAEAELLSINEFQGRVLVKIDSGERDYFAQGDIKFIKSHDSYLKVEVLRAVEKQTFLFQCLEKEECGNLVEGKLQILNKDELPQAVNPSKRSQRVFFSPSGEEYGKNLDEIKRYVRSEVDPNTAFGKSIHEKIGRLETKENVGAAISVPFAVAGVLGLGVVALASPGENEIDMRTDDQKLATLKLGLGSVASLGVAYIISSSTSPSDSDIQGLIYDIKNQSSWRDRTQPKLSFNYSPFRNNGEATISLGLRF